ncbi:HlyD family type I secretion periplasmic adaptor subunit [Teichococcus vastitatis]|uniref:HlyD family type I secretion periplasmic adaptor subunit n=1 Tax=Teichococcus vastitatis TaxID=2307076 RepID=UPI000E711D6D|nr:HlyD family type I secretion periplasmic adaptor subunit [Pseudoroseomonas vastitatis]
MSRSLTLIRPTPAALATPEFTELQGDVLALRTSIRAPVRRGLVLIFLFLGGFFAWAATVPIAGGAVAPGVVSPDGNRRTVQHLEGGIIAELSVRDGDKVQAGQRLVVLESLQARTVVNALTNQYYTLLAMQARLQAEQDGLSDMEVPQELADLTASNAELRKVVASQRVMFATRLVARKSRLLVLRKKIEQSQEQIRGLEAQIKSASEQIALIEDELKGKEQLVRAGYMARPEALRLQRARAEIQGRREEYAGTIARARQVIGETQMQIMALDAEHLDKVSEQSDKTRLDLVGITERLQASRDVLTRTVVTAPISGTVVNLHFKTVEGVIRPGEAILDIVPAEEALLIDARVSPSDIDVVSIGLPAQVHLTAYSSRSLPRIDGMVRSVSADRLTDPSNGQPYYLARVEVDRAELARLGSAVELVPGMPAEVLIVRKERTMIRYLLEPLLAAFRRSFREV